MDREEFLEGLARALRTAGMSEREIQDNVSYYDSYFRQQLSAGRTEQEILEELGDPRLLARTIAGVRDERGYGEVYEAPAGDGCEPEEREESSRGSGRADGFRVHSHHFQIQSGLGCLIAGIVVFLIISLIFTIIGGLFSLLAPVLVPLLVIALVLRIFTRR